jgi:very-short-patch-repair endonuclease
VSNSSRSRWEELLALQIAAAGLPAPEREHRFHPTRRWRFDFAWPDRLVAVEVEGGIWRGGRHTRGTGYCRDVEKYNAAALAGWTVLRVTPEMVRSGEAVRMVGGRLVARRSCERAYRLPTRKQL